MICRRHPILVAILAMAALARPAPGGSRSGGTSVITADTLDDGGARVESASYVNDTTLGGIGNLSRDETSGQALKSGYPGQLTEVVGVLLEAAPSPLNEDSAGQLSGNAGMDDDTVSPLAHGDLQWQPAAFPLAAISASGSFVSDVVYTDTVGTAAGTYHGVTGTASLIVKDIHPDNFRSYAGDTIADNWQVGYFGEENPDALPQADPDGDAQDNLSEYIAGTDPEDGDSYFDLWIQGVSGASNQIDVLYYPRLDRRTYAIERATALLEPAWNSAFAYSQSVTNETCIVRDLNTPNSDAYYRVQITRAITNCGYFTETFLPTMAAQYGDCVTIADLNEDGSPDYFVGYSGGGQVLFTTFNGFYPIVADSGQRLGTDAVYGAAAGDLNGDSHLDVLAAGPGGGRLWFNDGSGRFTNSLLVVTNTYCTSVAIGDLNGDHHNDLFIGRGTAASSFRNVVLTNDGAGLFGVVEQGAFIQDRTYAVALGDLDNDGDLDAYAANSVVNRCYRNDGQANFFLWGADARSDDSRGVVLADMNDDGYRDVVVANAWPGPSYVYLNRTGGVLEPFPIGAGLDDALGVAVADFNGDLRPDVATAGWENTALWLNLDGTNFSRSIQSFGNDLGQAAASQDMNGDSSPDLVIINYNTTNQLWLNECIP